MYSGPSGPPGHMRVKGPISQCYSMSPETHKLYWPSKQRLGSLLPGTLRKLLAQIWGSNYCLNLCFEPIFFVYCVIFLSFFIVNMIRIWMILNNQCNILFVENTFISDIWYLIWLRRFHNKHLVNFYIVKLYWNHFKIKVSYIQTQAILSWKKDNSYSPYWCKSQ